MNNMSWEVLVTPLRILLGMPCGLGVLPFERFFRHVSYMIYVGINASGMWGEGPFSKMNHSSTMNPLSRMNPPPLLLLLKLL